MKGLVEANRLTTVQELAPELNSTVCFKTVSNHLKETGKAKTWQIGSAWTEQKLPF